MSRPHLPLTVDEHVEFGNRLKDTRDALQRLLARMPATSRHGRDAARAVEALDRLRCSMDSLLCEWVTPRRDPRDLATFVYYGRDRFELRWYAPEELEKDDFVLWEREPHRLHTVPANHP